jgi:hypothetical protein
MKERDTAALQRVNAARLTMPNVEVLRKERRLAWGSTLHHGGDTDVTNS